MIQLYYTPRTRASRPRWALEELGVPYQLERIDLEKGEQRQPAFLKINPMGQVPVLVDDGEVIIESGAICLYLADKFNQLGPTPQDRGKFYQWCFFLSGTMEPPLMDYFLHTTRFSESDRSAFVAEKGKAGVQKAVDFLETHLQDRQFLLGDRFTMADILVGGSLSWIATMDFLEGREALLRYVGQLRQRPAFVRANAD